MATAIPKITLKKYDLPSISLFDGAVQASKAASIMSLFLKIPQPNPWSWGDIKRRDYLFDVSSLEVDLARQLFINLNRPLNFSLET